MIYPKLDKNFYPMIKALEDFDKKVKAAPLEQRTKITLVVDRNGGYNYVYSYDAATEEYVAHEIKVPMLFVQEEFFEDLADDVKDANNVDVFVKMNPADLEKLLSDYDRLIPILIENKELVGSDDIVAIIGDKVVFD